MLWAVGVTGVALKAPENPAGRLGKESAVLPVNPPLLPTSIVMGARLPGAQTL